MVSPLVEEYRKKHNSIFNNFINNLSYGGIIIISIIILVLIMLSKNSKRFSSIMIAMLLIIILYLAFKPSKIKILLDLETAGAQAQEYLERMRVDGRKIDFDSKIEVMPVGQDCYKMDTITGESAVISIDIGFCEYVHGSQYKKEGVVSVHPYDGTITGMSYMPLGYTGRERTTVTKIVPVGVMNIQGGTNTSDFKPAD
ncbi:MAG: hypothetical protein AABY22_01020 [Nanoarchaeota archaeon]